MFAAKVDLFISNNNSPPSTISVSAFGAGTTTGGAIWVVSMITGTGQIIKILTRVNKITVNLKF